MENKIKNFDTEIKVKNIQELEMELERLQADPKVKQLAFNKKLLLIRVFYNK